MFIEFAMNLGVGFLYCLTSNPYASPFYTLKGTFSYLDAAILVLPSRHTQALAPAYHTHTHTHTSTNACHGDRNSSRRKFPHPFSPCHFVLPAQATN